MQWMLAQPAPWNVTTVTSALLEYNLLTLSGRCTSGATFLSPSSSRTEQHPHRQACLQIATDGKLICMAQAACRQFGPEFVPGAAAPAPSPGGSGWALRNAPNRRVARRLSACKVARLLHLRHRRPRLRPSCRQPRNQKRAAASYELCRAALDGWCKGSSVLGGHWETPWEPESATFLDGDALHFLSCRHPRHVRRQPAPLQLQLQLQLHPPRALASSRMQGSHGPRSGNPCLPSRLPELDTIPVTKHMDSKRR